MILVAPSIFEARLGQGWRRKGCAKDVNRHFLPRTPLFYSLYGFLGHSIIQKMSLYSVVVITSVFDQAVQSKLPGTPVRTWVRADSGVSIFFFRPLAGVLTYSEVVLFRRRTVKGPATSMFPSDNFRDVLPLLAPSQSELREGLVASVLPRFRELCSRALQVSMNVASQYCLLTS